MALDEQGSIQHPFPGTSAAAPLVSGVAGLLFAFDPSLTAAEVKQLILDGAQRGQRAASDAVAGHSVYLVNAYESLKLAAERPGAPLCGNHVWLAGDVSSDTIVVQRGAGATEKIWSDPNGSLAIVNVKHGGRRISYSGPYYDDAIVYSPLTRQWRIESEEDSLPPAIDGGTFNSLWWTSHNGDSSLVFNRSAQTSPTVAIDLFDSHTLNTNPLSTIPTSVVNDTTPFCVQQSTVTGKCTKNEWIGEKQEANVLAAYSPLGDSAIVSVARTAIRDAIVTQWTPCGSKDSTGAYTEECRGVIYQKHSLDTKFYTIPIGTVTSNPPVSWTMDGARATQLTITEDGSELAIGHGVIDESISPDFLNCGITYRNLKTGQEAPVIPNGPACIYFGAVTASPLRTPGITLNPRE